MIEFFPLVTLEVLIKREYRWFLGALQADAFP
jgi:hypothetical protein